VADLVFLVGNEAALFFGKAKEFGDGVVEEGVGDVLFVEGEVILEVAAEGFFVLLVAFAREAFDEPAIREGLAGEAGQFGNCFTTTSYGNEVAATGEEPHGDFEAAEDAGAAGIDGKEFGMEAAVVDEDR